MLLHSPPTKTVRRGQKQGRIHVNPVADGLAGAVMQKPLVFQKCYLPTDGHVKFLSRKSKHIPSVCFSLYKLY